MSVLQQKSDSDEWSWKFDFSQDSYKKTFVFALGWFFAPALIILSRVLKKKIIF